MSQDVNERPPLRIRETSKLSLFEQYKLMIQTMTSWQALAETCEQYEHDPKLTDDEKDVLMRLANARELAIAPAHLHELLRRIGN